MPRRKPTEKIMLGSTSCSPQVDSSALASHHQAFPSSDVGAGQKTDRPSQFMPQNSGRPRQSRLWCQKFKKPNNSLDTCWRIHGKSTDWKPSREKRANSAACENPSTESSPFTVAQVEALQKLISQVHSHKIHHIWLLAALLKEVNYILLILASEIYPILG